MKVHYFQRYHGKENVATANTMLLLSRLYAYSPDKFYRVLEDLRDSNQGTEELQVQFILQEKSEKSVPDATITQKSFKIVVETKYHTNGKFQLDQLENHFTAFGNEELKILLALATERIRDDQKKKVEDAIREKKLNIVFISRTFEEVADAIRGVLTERDYEMNDILADFEDYCYKDKLISDSWKRMKVELAGQSIKKNMEWGFYFQAAGRSSLSYDYLGLYSNKAVRAIGKIRMVVRERRDKNGELEVLRGNMQELTDDIKGRIGDAMKFAESKGWEDRDGRDYLVVEKFYDTEYTKESKGAPMGAKIFDLVKTLGLKDVTSKKQMPSVEECATALREKKW